MGEMMKNEWCAESYGAFGSYDTGVDPNKVEWLSASCTLKGSVHRYLHIPILGSVHRIPFIINST